MKTINSAKIRKMYDNGDKINLIAEKLNLTFRQVEKAIIATAQVRQDTQPGGAI